MNARVGAKGWHMNGDFRNIVFGKAKILNKLAGVNYKKKVQDAKSRQLAGINGELDDKIHRIMNYRKYGHDPIVQAALAKHGVLSIAKLSK